MSMEKSTKTTMVALKSNATLRRFLSIATVLMFVFTVVSPSTISRIVRGFHLKRGLLGRCFGGCCNQSITKKSGKTSKHSGGSSSAVGRARSESKSSSKSSGGASAGSGGSDYGAVGKYMKHENTDETSTREQFVTHLRTHHQDGSPELPSQKEIDNFINGANGLDWRDMCDRSQVPRMGRDFNNSRSRNTLSDDSDEGQANTGRYIFSEARTPTVRGRSGDSTTSANQRALEEVNAMLGSGEQLQLNNVHGFGASGGAFKSLTAPLVNPGEVAHLSGIHDDTNTRNVNPVTNLNVNYRSSSSYKNPSTLDAGGGDAKPDFIDIPLSGEGPGLSQRELSDQLPEGRPDQKGTPPIYAARGPEVEEIDAGSSSALNHALQSHAVHQEASKETSHTSSFKPVDASTISSSSSGIGMQLKAYANRVLMPSHSSSATSTKGSSNANAMADTSSVEKTNEPVEGSVNNDIHTLPTDKKQLVKMTAPESNVARFFSVGWTKESDPPDTAMNRRHFTAEAIRTMNEQGREPGETHSPPHWKDSIVNAAGWTDPETGKHIDLPSYYVKEIGNNIGSAGETTMIFYQLHLARSLVDVKGHTDKKPRDRRSSTETSNRSRVSTRSSSGSSILSLGGLNDTKFVALPREVSTEDLDDPVKRRTALATFCPHLTPLPPKERVA